MRELTYEETKVVNGGNPLLAGIFSIAGSYYGGKSIGASITESITTRFGMSPGQAAYYTFNDK